MRTFCTILNSNYLPYALTLSKSLTRLHPGEKLYVLICDEEKIDLDNHEYPGITICRINELYGAYKADTLYAKYNGEMNKLRWSFKAVLINYLLGKGFDKVIYSDCDTFFFNDYDFLFDELDKHSILLTPAWTTRDPAIREEEFLTCYKYGLYNAGFIGATKKAVPALEWWTDCCCYRIEINFPEGLFYDQKYLDALPVFFEDAFIVRHPGCNIANWNQHELKRTRVNGKLLINEKYPVIFIHFTSEYIPELRRGNDPLVYDLLKEFEKHFEMTGSKLDQFIPGLPGYKEPGPLLKLKRKLLIRTRIKRWLSRLSKSI